MKKFLSILLIAGAIFLTAPSSQSHAGDYTSKVLIPWSFTVDGITYGSFYAGGFRWGIVLTNNPAGLGMFQLATAAFIAGRNIQVGCQVCSATTLSKYPVGGTQSFWIPETVMIQ